MPVHPTTLVSHQTSQQGSQPRPTSNAFMHLAYVGLEHSKPAVSAPSCRQHMASDGSSWVVIGVLVSKQIGTTSKGAPYSRCEQSSILSRSRWRSEPGLAHAAVAQLCAVDVCQCKHGVCFYQEANLICWLWQPNAAPTAAVHACFPIAMYCAMLCCVMLCRAACRWRVSDLGGSDAQVALFGEAHKDHYAEVRVQGSHPGRRHAVCLNLAAALASHSPMPFSFGL